MAADTGMKLVVAAGALTFGNEWYQSHELNWRVLVATALAAAGTAGVGKLSPGAGTSLGVMALIVAAVTPFSGKSPVQQLQTIVNGQPSTVNIQKVT